MLKEKVFQNHEMFLNDEQYVDALTATNEISFRFSSHASFNTRGLIKMKSSVVGEGQFTRTQQINRSKTFFSFIIYY